ncbi:MULTISPECIES: hypothetical protein [Cysteiniphilum]|uniref:Uncharacterized protein n=1 Tax=Cysteiniphilum litorale TaxID=2056700 RepID=A0A8J2Z2D6_9GAMM|nr:MULTISPECIES: hypothetical protein [Cysteiniphilum]GGF88900.1 hypothetical protein GCM10010995_02700 [Cysteiniphilum litorale]
MSVNLDMYNACEYKIGLRSNLTGEELPRSRAAYNLADFNDPLIITCQNAKDSTYDQFAEWRQKIINAIELMKAYDDHTTRSLYLIKDCQPH